MSDTNKKHKSREQDRGIPASQNIQKETESKLDKLNKIPAVVKALFLKFWVVGACFFFLWMSDIGLVINNFDLLVAFGAAVGLFQNLVVNRFLRAFDDGDGKHLQYVLFHKKSWYFIFIDIVYCIAIAILVMLTYSGINKAINSANGYDAATIIFKSEPLGVGAIFVLYDFICICFKKLIFKLLKLDYGIKSELISDDDVIVDEN